MAHPDEREEERGRRERIEEQGDRVPQEPHLQRQFPTDAIRDPAEEEVRGGVHRRKQPDDDSDRHEVGADVLRVQRDHRNERVRVHRSEHRRGEQIQGPPRGHDWRDARDAQKDEPTRFT